MGLPARALLLWAAGALLCLPLAAAAQERRTAPGGEAALACGQGPDGRSYWTEYAFCDIAVKGPTQAKGLVLWSHGVSGQRDQYKGPVSPVVRRLAQAGWDVIRINRNPLYERGWATSGPRHRDDAIERVRAARAQGYRHIILAGQSYGGAISLEANTREAVDGVMAFSPGHGSDMGNAGGGGGGIYFNLDRYLLQAVAAQKGGRVVVLMAPNDHLHPNRHDPSGYIGPKVRATLATAGRPHLVFDETAPVHGHGAGHTAQFNAWFGECIVRFLDMAAPAPAGETRCAAPDPLPRFLLPADLKLGVVVAPTGARRWLGGWEGRFEHDQREVLVGVERIDGEAASLIYAVGAGPQRNLSMGWERHAKVAIAGDRMKIERRNKTVLELVLAADGRSLDFTMSGNETWRARLARQD